MLYILNYLLNMSSELGCLCFPTSLYQSCQIILFILFFGISFSLEFSSDYNISPLHPPHPNSVVSKKVLVFFTLCFKLFLYFLNIVRTLFPAHQAYQRVRFIFLQYHICYIYIYIYWSKHHKYRVVHCSV